MIDAPLIPALDEAELTALAPLDTRRSVEVGEYLYREREREREREIPPTPSLSCYLDWRGGLRRPQQFPSGPAPAVGARGEGGIGISSRSPWRWYWY